MATFHDTAKRVKTAADSQHKTPRHGVQARRRLQPVERLHRDLRALERRAERFLICDTSDNDVDQALAHWLARALRAARILHGRAVDSASRMLCVFNPDDAAVVPHLYLHRDQAHNVIDLADYRREHAPPAPSPQARLEKARARTRRAHAAEIAVLLVSSARARAERAEMGDLDAAIGALSAAAMAVNAATAALSDPDRDVATDETDCEAARARAEAEQIHSRALRALRARPRRVRRAELRFRPAFVGVGAGNDWGTP